MRLAQQIPVIYVRTSQQWLRGLDARVYDYGLVAVVAFLMGVLLGLLDSGPKSLVTVSAPLTLLLWSAVLHNPLPQPCMSVILFLLQIVNDMVLVQTALGVVCCVSSLRVFSENQVMHWREASTGSYLLHPAAAQSCDIG